MTKYIQIGDLALSRSATTAFFDSLKGKHVFDIFVSKEWAISYCQDKDNIVIHSEREIMTRKIASLEKWLASKDDIASNFLEYWNGRSIDLGEIDPSMKNKYDVDISFFVLHRNLYDRLVRADRYLKSRKVKSQNFNHNKFNYLIHDLSETICRPDIAVKLASAVRSACEDNTQFICCFCRYLEIYNLRKSGQYNLALSVSDNVDSKLEAEYIYSDPSFQYLVMVSTVRSACFLDRYEESRNNNDFRSAESSLNLAEELGGTSDYTKNVRIRLTSLKRRKSRNSE